MKKRGRLCKVRFSKLERQAAEETEDDEDSDSGNNSWNGLEDSAD